MHLSRVCPLLVLALAPTLATAAEPAVTHVKAGVWQATNFRDPANPGCSIGGPGSMPGGRLIMGANRRRPDPMNLIVRKAGWAIPDGTPVTVQAAFPDGTTMRFTGRGKGQNIEVDMPAGQLRDWVHGLTASAAMQLSFGGSEPPWTFDLTGTSVVINAMDDCFRGHGITGVAPPFDAASSGTQPFGVPGATQPFGAPAPSRPPSAAPPPDDAGGGRKQRFGPAAPLDLDDADADARASPAQPSPPVRGALPGDQAAFLAAIEDARRSYRAAPDDLARGSVRPGRAAALCRAVPSPDVRDWVGTVAAVGASPEGKGTLSLQLAPGVTARTWGTAASDYGDGTLIEPSSPLFPAVTSLRAGQRVRFSASLVPDRADCFREAGTSLSGSMTAPEFIMRLEAVQAAP